MSFVRFDFLNWQPDQNDWEYDGLNQALNVYHSDEGWRGIKSPTTGAFATTTPFSGSALTTINSIRVKTYGNNQDQLAMVLYRGSVSDTAYAIGPVGDAAFFTVQLATMASINAATIKAFAVAELNQTVLVHGVVEYTLAGGTLTSDTTGGTFSYTLTSV
jgi:hypothetical protein